MEDSIAWIRKNTPNIDMHLDDPTVEAVTNLAGHSLPPGMVPKDSKKKALEDSLTWLRNNDPSTDDVDDPTLEALSTLTGLSLPKSSTTKNKEMMPN